MVGEKHLNSSTRPYYFRRCKRSSSTHIESLPDDVLFHILVRLPADHLYERARVVCRRWYSIIHSRAFVNTQVQHSTYGFLLSGIGHPIFMSATQGRIGIDRFSYFSRHRIMSSCNGLGLEYQIQGNYDTGRVQIVNLATKQVLVLPSFSSKDYMYYKGGIAYAPTSMKYKVIVLQQHLNNLAILTVGVDNSWRHLSLENLSALARILMCNRPLTTEGFFHWVSSGPHCLTLDVETEVFTFTEAPLQPATLKRLYFVRYVEPFFLPTGKFLTLLVSPRDFCFEVWGMEPRSGEWRKMLPDINLEAQERKLKKFANPRSVLPLMPLGWVKYPEVLAMAFPKTYTCIFFNLDTHEISSTKFPELSGFYRTSAHQNSLNLMAYYSSVLVKHPHSPSFS